MQDLAVAVDRSHPTSAATCAAVELGELGELGGISSSAVENLTGKRPGKRSRLMFTFKIDPINICTRNFPKTNGLEPHMIEPGSHLAQLVSQFSGLYSYFDNVKHEPSSLLPA